MEKAVLCLLQGDQVEEEQKKTNSVPTLANLCQAAVRDGVSQQSVCSVLSMVDLLQPVLDKMAPTLISFLARNLASTLEADPQGFKSLPASLMAELLGNPCLV